PPQADRVLSPAAPALGRTGREPPGEGSVGIGDYFPAVGRLQVAEGQVINAVRDAADRPVEEDEVGDAVVPAAEPPGVGAHERGAARTAAVLVVRREVRVIPAAVNGGVGAVAPVRAERRGRVDLRGLADGDGVAGAVLDAADGGGSVVAERPAGADGGRGPGGVIVRVSARVEQVVAAAGAD